MGTSRVSSTYCKMEVQVASGYAIHYLLMRRLMRTDITLAAPAALKLATFSRFNHLWHNQWTVDASRCVSPAICRIDQPTLLSLIMRLFVKSPVCLKCLRWWWLGILCYYTCLLKQEQNFYVDFPSRTNGTNVSHSGNSLSYIVSNMRWRVAHFISFE